MSKKQYLFSILSALLISSVVLAVNSLSMNNIYEITAELEQDSLVLSDSGIMKDLVKDYATYLSQAGEAPLRGYAKLDEFSPWGQRNMCDTFSTNDILACKRQEAYSNIELQLNSRHGGGGGGDSNSGKTKISKGESCGILYGSNKSGDDYKKCQQNPTSYDKALQDFYDGKLILVQGSDGKGFFVTKNNENLKKYDTGNYQVAFVDRGQLRIGVDYKLYPELQDKATTQKNKKNNPAERVPASLAEVDVCNLVHGKGAAKEDEGALKACQKNPAVQQRYKEMLAQSGSGEAQNNKGFFGRIFDGFRSGAGTVVKVAKQVFNSTTCGLSQMGTSLPKVDKLSRAINTGCNVTTISNSSASGTPVFNPNSPASTTKPNSKSPASTTKPNSKPPSSSGSDAPKPNDSFTKIINGVTYICSGGGLARPMSCTPRQ